VSADIRWDMLLVLLVTKHLLIKYWKTSVRNTVFLVLDFIVHFSHTLHVSAPFGGHLQVVHKHKNIQGSHHIFNGSVESWLCNIYKQH
jgi:hypothetical protein